MFGYNGGSTGILAVPSVSESNTALTPFGLDDDIQSGAARKSLAVRGPASVGTDHVCVHLDLSPIAVQCFGSNDHGQLGAGNLVHEVQAWRMPLVQYKLTLTSPVA